VEKKGVAGRDHKMHRLSSRGRMNLEFSTKARRAGESTSIRSGLDCADWPCCNEVVIASRHYAKQRRNGWVEEAPNVD